MQDRRVLDYCDRHGILMQLEVPAWGGRTFAGMKEEPSREILANGLEQLREMIEQNRNHPSVFAWGLCNEVNGQNPPAQQFIRALAREARRLDPSRPLTYASHSLNKTPERDVAGELDIIEWNEYFGSWYKGTVDDLRDALGRIRAAFPKKPIVVSEYGLCECAAGNPVGDDRRIEVLEAHNRLFREYPDVAGLIFFCYNDYRTHIGDKGAGALKQRVHGVVDLYGAHKPSYEVLRRESSPVESFSATLAGGAARVSLRTRATVPAYTLRGYTLRCTVYAYGGLPMEEHTAALPALAPGASHQAVFPIAEQKPARVVLDVLRPSGASCATTTVT
jgi:beta-glucuronidase